MPTRKAPERASKSTPPVVAAPTTEHIADASTAFEVTRADRDALDRHDLLAVNVDPGAAALIALGALPSIRMYASEIRALAPSCAHAVDSLERYAHATLHAHSLFKVSTSNEEFARLFAEITTWRSRLLGVLSLAASFEIVDEAVVVKLRNAQGYRGWLEATGAAEDIVRKHWARLEGKNPLTVGDLATARDVAARFLEAHAQRSATAAGQTQSAIDRQRAFTLLANAYEEIRCALRFLRRRENDFDRFAPSLWLQPGGGRRGGRGAARGGEEKVSPTANSSFEVERVPVTTTANPAEVEREATS